MAEVIHPFYRSHRGAMVAAMRDRLDLAEAMLGERAQLSDIDGIRQQVMDEFEIVLAQMPYVGGAENRMSHFFMRLMGFLAIGRVLQRHGVPLPVIGDIEREILKAQLAEESISPTVIAKPPVVKNQPLARVDLREEVIDPSFDFEAPKVEIDDL